MNHKNVVQIVLKSYNIIDLSQNLSDQFNPDSPCIKSSTKHNFHISVNSNNTNEERSLFEEKKFEEKKKCLFTHYYQAILYCLYLMGKT